MKKSRKILHLFLAVMLAFSFLTSVVYAVTSTQDGLEAEIITDKEVYKANEEILVTVKVKNTNSFLIKRVSIEGLLPDELTLKKGNELSKQIEALNAGETIELTFTAIKVKEKPSTEETTTQPTTAQSTAPATNSETTKPVVTTIPATTDLTESASTSLPVQGIVTTSASTLNSTTAPEPSSTQQENIPQTGDNSRGMIALCSILILGAIVALFFVLRNRNYTKFNRVISVILCVAMLIPSALGVGFYTAKALDNRKGFTVTKTITVDGKEYDTSANIFYEKTEESGFNEKELKQMSEVDNSICDIMGSNDYINGDNDEKVKILEEQLLKLQKKGLIIKGSIHYDDNLNQFYFKYKNGIAGHIVLKTKNKYDSNSSLLDDVSLSISTIDKQITKKDNITAVSNSEEVHGVLTYGFDNVLDSEAYSEVKKVVEDVNKKGMDTTLLKLPTIEQYKKVFKNQDFICIFEHGLQFTTETFDTITITEPTYGFSVKEEISTEETDKHYSGDISSERIGKYIDGDGKSCYFITPDFFNFYYGDNKLEDSIVYLMSCQGFGVDNNYDYEFARTVTKKCGAKAVIGFHNSVAAGYAITVLEAITGYMLQGYTIKEAFDFVSQIYGITDYSYADWLLHNVSLTLSQQKEWLKLKENKENNHATLMLYGDEDANFHIKSGTVSGFVKDGHSNKPIKDVDIEFIINDTSGKFKTTTDSDGKFFIRLPFGNYPVTFEHTLYSETSTSFIVDCDEVVVLEPIFLIPVILDGNVTGVVKDTGNKGLQNVLVEAIPKGSTEVIQSVTTNILGDYSIPLPHGEYTLRYSKEGYKTKTIEVNFNEHSVKPVDVVVLGVGGAERPAIASGTCGSNGDNVTWVLYEDGELIISGVGAMKTFYYGSYAPWFSYRSSITDIVIENGVTSIGDYAFYSCDKITNFEIPNTVTRIGDYAYASCGNVTDIIIPDSVNYLGKSAFAGCQSLENVQLGRGINALRSTNTRGDNFEEDTGTFEGCINLKNIIMLGNIISIGSKTFANCTSLTNMKIPDSVTSIGGGAFYGCSSLETVELGNKIKSLNASKYYYYSNQSLYEYQYGFFEGCTNLKNITIPNSVATIGDDAFANCTSLKDIEIPDSVTSIGGGVFYNCSALKSAKLSDSITTLSFSSEYYGYTPSVAIANRRFSNFGFFEGCISLINIEIPINVLNIGERAFYHCDSLEGIKILNAESEISDSKDTICGSATIYGYIGSTAQAYAEEYNRKFVALD